MSALKNVFKFEFYKILRSKPILFIVIVVLFSAVLIPTVHYFCAMPSVQPILPDREITKEHYRKELSDSVTFLAEYGETMTKKERESHEIYCKKLRYYLDSGTVESDYMNAQLLTEKQNNHVFSGFMFYFSTVSAFVLWALSILSASYLFVSEFHTQTIKNLVTGQVKRKKIFMGKLLVLLAFITLVSVLFFLYSLFFGVIQSNSRLLVLFNGNYRSIGVIGVFLTQAAATFVVSLFFASITVFSGIVFKNAPIAVATSAAFYGLALLMSFAFTNMAYANPGFYLHNAIKYLPIFSLQFHVGGFDTTFTFAFLLHSICAIGMTVAACRLFKKQDL